MRSSRYILLHMYTQVLDTTAQDVISNEKNRAVAVGFSRHSCTTKSCVHIKIAKKKKPLFVLCLSTIIVHSHT